MMNNRETTTPKDIDYNLVALQEYLTNYFSLRKKYKPDNCWSKWAKVTNEHNNDSISNELDNYLHPNHVLIMVNTEDIYRECLIAVGDLGECLTINMKNPKIRAKYTTNESSMVSLNTESMTSGDKYSACLKQGTIIGLGEQYYQKYIPLRLNDMVSFLVHKYTPMALPPSDKTSIFYIAHSCEIASSTRFYN